jgi:CheY-like chemotaxis protein
MIVLVGDDDAVSQYALRKAMSEVANCEIVEARTGPDVLDKLHRQAPDVLIMEERLAIIDGVEALQILRRSPRFASLPVVMTTAGIDEPRARRLIGLGVRDILVKPLEAARLERVATFLGGLEAHSTGPRTRQPALRLQASSSALLVDGDKDYREYFTKAVKGRLTLTTADSGAKALEMCHRTPPDIVFLGTDLGLVDRAHVARKLRGVPRRTVRIVAIPQKSEAEAERATGLFDDVLMRTYAPAAFERELERWLRGTATFERLSGRLPNIRLRVIRAAEQVFGTMLGTDVEPQEAPSVDAGPHATASVTLTSPPFVMTLRVMYGMVAARDIAGAFLETDATDLPEEDVLAVAGKVVSMLAGRLKAAFEEVEFAAALGLPALALQPESPSAEALPHDQGTDVSFKAIDRPVGFRIQLTVDPAETLAGETTVAEESGVTTIRSEATA